MHKTSRLLISVLLILALSTALVPARATQAAAPADLFISEYIEGTSNNKAIEIYNGTGAPVDLAAGGYNIQMYFNGSSTAGLTINLVGTVASGDVFVLAHDSADAAIKAQADQTNNAGWFNGDDAVVLRKGTTVLDVIGQIGFDPGTEWGTGLTSTADNTLRRNESVCAGDTDGSDPFDPAAEWTGFATNTFDGLGAHTASCDTVVLPSGPVLNEFSASTTGDDVEYVEIYGEPLTDYSAFTILEIEGDDPAPGVIDEVIPLGVTDENGIYNVDLPTNALENGTISLLLVSNFTGALGDDLDTNNDGIFDITPWDKLVDAVAVSDGGANDRTYGGTVLGPNYDGLSSFTPGGASRYPDGADSDAASDWVRNDFDLAGIPGFPGTIQQGEAYNTPGAPNQIYTAPPEACGDPFTPIYTVQGSGAASPLAGQEVAIEGVVVGDFQNNAAPDSGDLNGFYLQDPAGDGDPATSDGIFVYAPGAADVQVGDALRVRGLISEFNGLTEITASQIWTCPAAGAVTPTELALPVNSIDDFEAYEGMLVTFPQELVIAEYFNYDRYGEIVLTSRRHTTPTALYEPGSPEAYQAMQDYLLDSITLDDGRTPQNPDPAIHPNGGVFDLNNLFRGGDTVKNLTGVMDYSFGLYRIQPTQGAEYTPANPRPEQPEDVGGSLKVASFNVLNYFLTIDTGDWICGPSGKMECRGADDEEELERQRAKIIAALAKINADVVGLIEIENDADDAAAADLAAGLNAVLGDGTYDYIPTGFIGTDAIKQAILYKPGTVTPAGSYALLDSTVDSRFLDDKNRPALAQTFVENSTGGVFTVAVNHLKSKGSDCNDVDDPDLGDGAGNCNITRTQAAAALVDWLASDPTGSGSSNFLIIGDLNSYDKEDPIDTIKAAGYTDLIYAYQGEYAYSYVFDGQTGYLDHALASESLTPQVTGATIWHINADEPDLIDYDTSFKQPAQDAIYAPDPFRASDHDPVIAGLALCETVAPTLEVSVSPDTLWPANHKYVDVTAAVTAADNFDPNPTIELVSVTSNEPDDGSDDGNTVNDIAIVDDFHFKLRAERSGTGTGRVYTITYKVTDACGNETVQSAEVRVPLNKGK
ncbi:MAG: ExeM/NucH family extracellular endonuclease [Chloroflexi bacterium]|nr:ExeM/NucH family extracellular endonuclease [Chloroflexota bacterium]